MEKSAFFDGFLNEFVLLLLAAACSAFFCVRPSVRILAASFYRAWWMIWDASLLLEVHWLVNRVYFQWCGDYFGGGAKVQIGTFLQNLADEIICSKIAIWGSNHANMFANVRFLMEPKMYLYDGRETWLQNVSVATLCLIGIFVQDRSLFEYFIQNLLQNPVIFKFQAITVLSW